MITAYDETKQDFREAEVIAVQAFKDKKDIVDLHLSSDKIITLTKSHPVLTTRGWAALDLKMARREHWVDVVLLEEGDELITNDDTKVYIDKIVERPDLDGSTVYNIDVEPYDTYIVENIIVHNASSKT